MDEDEEINIMSETTSTNIPLVSQNSELLNCEYTVHPQWLLDKPSTNPDCWYNNSIELSSEEPEQEYLGHITTENSITDESGWTEKEKNLLERGIEIFGKSALRLSQFIGTKTPSEVRYYFKSFYNELHPVDSVKSSLPKFSEESVILENVLVDSQIPCINEQVVGHKMPVCAKNNKVMFNRKGTRIKIKMNSILHKRQRNSEITSIRNKSLSSVQKPRKQVKIQSLGRANSVLNKQEEIVNIKSKLAESSDSDIDIDVVDDSESSVYKNTCSRELVETTENMVHKESDNSSMKNDIYSKEVLGDSVSEINIEVMDHLTSLDIPKCELHLEEDAIDEVEKFIYREVFSMNASHVKSAESYLSLRNHILSKWRSKKPQYLTKTDIRKDTHRLVDYNALCRIHTFMEQLGAINYGCGRVRYVRPLQRLIKSTEVIGEMKKTVHPRRFKKKFVHNGEGGCTVSHGADGEIIDTMVINEDPAPPKLKTVRKQPTYLIYCKPFLQPYKYKVKLNLSTLLMMDFHANSSLTEVMGLIGGT
ncbi:hypothetical protein HHI36_021849 [Cryptolaemus montrouzieri]|uniref:SANT domain-containing protein n=1 Tax=Cryptolaemus montrouzieri TaxID=559131 RepID=A0ABD2MXX8_9CUCU